MASLIKIFVRNNTVHAHCDPYLQTLTDQQRPMFCYKWLFSEKPTTGRQNQYGFNAAAEMPAGTYTLQLVVMDVLTWKSVYKEKVKFTAVVPWTRTIDVKNFDELSKAVQKPRSSVRCLNSISCPDEVKLSWDVHLDLNTFCLTRTGATLKNIDRVINLGDGCTVVNGRLAGDPKSFVLSKFSFPSAIYASGDYVTVRDIKIDKVCDGVGMGKKQFGLLVCGLQTINTWSLWGYSAYLNNTCSVLQDFVIQNSIAEHCIRGAGYSFLQINGGSLTNLDQTKFSYPDLATKIKDVAKATFNLQAGMNAYVGAGLSWVGSASIGPLTKGEGKPNQRLVNVVVERCIGDCRAGFDRLNVNHGTENARIGGNTIRSNYFSIVVEAATLVDKKVDYAGRNCKNIIIEKSNHLSFGTGRAPVSVGSGSEVTTLVANRTAGRSGSQLAQYHPPV